MQQADEKSPAQLSSVFLSAFGLRRLPPRPEKDREPGYDEKFDHDTLFYDLFLSDDGRRIVAPCPPLLNCESNVTSGVFRASPGALPLPYTSASHSLGGTFHIGLPEGAPPSALSIEIDGKSVTVPVRPSGCEMFAGRKVIFALSKDNPLPWIKDWATFNVRIHGADAVLFYDNGSSAYGLDEIHQTLREVDGLQSVLVVPWPFRFGPGHGPNNEWDSNYCKNRALAHARWRYCARARAFLNSDIDELVIAKNGGSVFARLAASHEPCLTYAGRWVSAIRSGQEKSAGLLRHSDCVYLENEPPYPNKWVADPRRIGDAAEWFTHTIAGLTGTAALAAEERSPMVADLEFRHCRQISTDWKYARHWLPFYRSELEYDRAFAAALARAFPDRAIPRLSLSARIRDRLRAYRQHIGF